MGKQLITVVLNQYRKFDIDKEMYERAFLGIWPKQNPTIEKKEGNKMIESMNLINLYEKNQCEKIEKEYHNKILEIREKLSLKEKVADIINKAEEELNKLYFSQFTEEQKKDWENGKVIDQSQFSLIRREEIRLTSDGTVYVNDFIENDEIHNLYKEMAIKLDEIKEKIKVIKTHVAIAKNKDEVEEILNRYDVLDKKGKLVIK